MPVASDTAKRQELLAKLKNNPRGLYQILGDPDVVAELREDAAKYGDDAIIPPKILEDYIGFAEVVRNNPRGLQAAGGSPVLVVPGFLGSALTDTTGGNGLIWIDPSLVVDGQQLSALELAAWNSSSAERDNLSGVTISALSEVPVAYDLLMWRLYFGGYDAKVYPYDWRKNIDESAEGLVLQIRARSLAAGNKKVHVIAHSQGSLVARRALHLLGKTEVDRLVETLVLLGPATFGTFTAAMAISGSHQQLELFQNWAINAPANVAQIFQSMSGLYQLLPWNPTDSSGQPLIPAVDVPVESTAFWQSGVDSARLRDLWGWAGKNIDTSFFNSRTRIILGQDNSTTASAQFQNGKLVETKSAAGDGVVLDERAKLPGVRTFKAAGAKHGWMAAAFNVTGAVLKILGGNDPDLNRALGFDGKSLLGEGIIGLIPEEHFEATRRLPRAPAIAAPVLPAAVQLNTVEAHRAPAAPVSRKLRVFSMDPVLMSNAETAPFGTMICEIPWEGAGQSGLLSGELQPGPVGEYLEVVDVDPQSGRYYFPIDLNHPHVLAECGLRPTETDPRFHQQMVYAVSMATIKAFETALGRVALWSPHLQRDARGEVVRPQTDDEFVQRLRIYPHAMRQRNAYYDPDRKALLFGYFPSASASGSQVQPGATVFTCLSFDIVAHETTHALLDGMHRYFNTPSNRDVFAFHEAFADIVALLQRFSNSELMRRQIRVAKGKLTNRSLIGQMATQFGEASGGRGGLRQYLGRFNDNNEWDPVKPDPAQVAKVSEPHMRGALLVAAMFQALNTMYEQRASDLFDIARRDDGTVVFSRELENRLASEAATAARHLLEMSIRAMDYVPPVDIGFGDFLRGLITADCEIVANDRFHYRAAIVNAFSEWGIYPSDRQTQVPDDLAWEPPTEAVTGGLLDWLQQNPLADWQPGMNRESVFRESKRLAATLHAWIAEFGTRQSREVQKEFGLDLDPNGNNHTINRDAKGIPVFEVHSVRPCRRVSPDGQSRRDVVIEIVQRRKAFFDANVQQQMDSGAMPYGKLNADFYFRGGCTLIVDGRSGKIRFLMSKNIASEHRLQAEREFRGGTGVQALAANYFHGLGEENPFRLMHTDH